MLMEDLSIDSLGHSVLSVVRVTLAVVVLITKLFGFLGEETLPLGLYFRAVVNGLISAS